MERIGDLNKPTNPEIFITNSTIRPIHDKHVQQNPDSTIGFGPHCHTTSTTSAHPSSSADQCLQTQFQQSTIGLQLISKIFCRYDHYRK